MVYFPPSGRRNCRMASILIGAKMPGDFRTAVPFWGRTTQISSSLSPKRDCGPKGVKHIGPTVPH